MREIKFRGYAVERMVGEQWLYGCGVEELDFTEKYAEQLGRKSDWYLHTDHGLIRVHEKSIGQYTGLKDKNGVEIYEGDIFEATSKFGVPDELELGVVGFSEISGYQWEQWDLDDLEVIGNIYDSPEILEKWYEDGLVDQ